MTGTAQALSMTAMVAQQVQAAVAQAQHGANWWTVLWASLGGATFTHLLGWAKSLATPANEAKAEVALEEAAPVVTAALNASGHPMAGQAVNAIAAVVAQQQAAPKA